MISYSKIFPNFYFLISTSFVQLILHCLFYGCQQHSIFSCYGLRLSFKSGFPNMTTLKCNLIILKTVYILMIQMMIHIDDVYFEHEMTLAIICWGTPYYKIIIIIFQYTFAISWSRSTHHFLGTTLSYPYYPSVSLNWQSLFYCNT